MEVQVDVNAIFFAECDGAVDLFKRLVIEERLAVMAGAHYQGTALDDTRFYIYAVPAPDVSLERLDAAIDQVIARAAQGLAEADVTRAKNRLIADAIYAQDNQATLARWYGSTLAAGMSLSDVAEWPQRIETVTTADVQKAIRWLDKKRSVTGFLLPAGPLAPPLPEEERASLPL